MHKNDGLSALQSFKQASGIVLPNRDTTIPPVITGNISPSRVAKMPFMQDDFAFIDTETTGVDAEVDRVIEIAIVRYRNDAREVWHSLINPLIPIPPSASAVHHITNAQVKEAPLFHEIKNQVVHMLKGAYIVAHNAAFDKSFLESELCVTDPNTYWDKGWVCSYRLSRHLMENAPGYGNQVLRYWLETDPKTENLGAHRAIDDVYVSLETLFHLWREAELKGLKSFAALKDLSESPILVDAMPFGMHSGKTLSEIPLEYFNWALGLVPWKPGLAKLDED